MLLSSSHVADNDFLDDWGINDTEEALAVSSVDDSQLKDCIADASASVWGVPTMRPAQLEACICLLHPHRRQHLRQHHRHRTGRAGTRTTTQGAPRKAPGITSCDRRRNRSIRCTRYTSSCTARGKRCSENRLKSQRICFRCLRPDGNHPKTLGHRPNRRQRCNGPHEQQRGSSFTHHRPGSNKTTQVPAKAGEGGHANNFTK